MSERLHEDAVRLVRQRLIALEDGRDDDAATLEKFIADEFGLHLEDDGWSGLKWPTDEDAIDPRSPDAIRLRQEDRWRDVYGVPESAARVSLLVEYAREPVFRIPDDLEDRSVSAFELPSAAFGPVPARAEYEDLPENLRPRQDGALPPRVLKAMRLR